MPDEKVYLNYRPGDTSFILRVPFSKKDRAKKIGGVWDQAAKGWRFPVDAGLWQQIRQAFGGNGDLLVDRAFLDKLQAVEDNQRRFAEMKRLAEEDNPIDFEVPGVALNGKNPLFNYQKWGVKCAAMAEDGFLIGDVMGLGKAEIVDNRVFTPEGRKRIGDLKPGDRVIGSDGKPTRVTAVYPQGVLDIFELTFSDGSTIKCGGEHLWTVYDHRGDCPRTFTVNEMLDQNLVKRHFGNGRNAGKEYALRPYYKDINGQARWQIPMAKPLRFERESPLPLDPYLFGTLLGDGHFGIRQVSITEHEDDFDEMFGSWIRTGALGARELQKPKGRSRLVAFDCNAELRELGLFGKRSYEKFIPECYKYASAEARLALLQGLMDTDGHCQRPTKANCDPRNFTATEFCTSSPQLAADVRELVETLGGIARMHTKATFYRKDGVRNECRTAYRLNIKLPAPLVPFRLARKAAVYRIPRKYAVARMLRDIRPAGKAECVCIAVDAPDHLYVTEHCLVTHNTIQGIATAILRRQRGEISNCLVVCPASLKYNWLDEIAKFTKERALVIDGTAKERRQKWMAAGYFFKIANYETIVNDLFVPTDPRVKARKAPLPVDEIAFRKYMQGASDMLVLDECFSYYSQVLLADGTSEYIGKIVVRKMDVKVMSYNWETGVFEPKRIVNYFSNGKKPLLKLITQYGSVQVTATHKYYRLDGSSVLAGDLKPGDKIVVYNKGAYSIRHIAVLAGMLLGDGCLFVNRMHRAANMARVSCTHGMKQRDYAEWKMKLVGSTNGREVVSKNPATFAKSVFNFSSKSVFPKNIYDLFYEDGKKRVTRKWMECLTWFSIAIWYMDDGHLQSFNYRRQSIAKISENADYIKAHLGDYQKIMEMPPTLRRCLRKKLGLNPKIRLDKWLAGYLESGVSNDFIKGNETNTFFNCAFHTEGFSKAENDLLSAVLREKFGLDNKVSRIHKRFGREGYYYYIVLTQKASRRLCEKISPFVIPSMRYKLIPGYEFYNQEKVDSEMDGGALTEAAVLKVYPWETTRFNYTYNIEVEDNHNYICGGSLVSNCHACKHYESQRTQAVKQLRAKYRLGLSGTPIDGRLEELHSIFQFLKPGLFENRRLFLEKHAQFDGFGRVTGYFNVQEVRDRIAPYYLRRLKENVLKDLPPKLFKDIYVELPKPEMGVYRDLIRGAHEITEEAEAITRLMRVRQFLDFPEIIDLHNPSAKFEALSALLEELVYGNGEKAIIFTQYKEALDRIVKNLAGRYRIAQIHGGIGAKERVEIVKDFNESKTLQLLVGTDAMSTGLNIGGAHAVIHYEDSFSPAIMQQRNDRAHRATTRHTVTVYRFVCVGTVEEKFRRALGDKMDLNNRVLDENCGEFGSTGLRAIDILKYL